MGRSGKGLINSLGLKAKTKPERYQKERYAIVNVSKKHLLKIIREFEKIPDENYKSKRPKHEPTNSYVYLARQREKFMMRSDALNTNNYPVRT